MEELLVQFINTLDLSLKKFQHAAELQTGFSGLTISQLQYIQVVGELGTPTITEIANRLHFSKASVTASIHKLAASGYVTKNQSGDDRRVFHVSLTESGKQLVQVKQQTVKAYAAFVRAALDEAETRQFTQIMQKLVRQFNEGVAE